MLVRNESQLQNAGRAQFYLYVLIACTSLSIGGFTGIAAIAMWQLQPSYYSASLFGLLSLGITIGFCFAQLAYGIDQSVPKIYHEGDDTEAYLYWFMTTLGALLLAFLCSLGPAYLPIVTFATAGMCAWYLGWRCQ